MPTRKPTIAHLRSKGHEWMRQRLRAVAQRLMQTSERSPIAVGGIALAITTSVILGLDFVFEPSFKDILVEAHGLIFDLLLFGIIILAIDLWREKRERVTRHQEELDDYRGWHEPEASYRIAGLIKRLLRDGTKVNDLAGVYLAEADLRTLNLWGIDLSKANLASVNFANSILGDVKFCGANLRGASLVGATVVQANFEAADLTGADLRRAQTNLNNFRNATLDEANMSGLNLNGCTFSGATLRHTNLTGTALSGQTSNIDLTGADLRHGHIGKVDLSHANLHGAVLEGAYLYEIVDIDGWSTLGSIRNANVHCVKDQPTGYMKAQLRSWVCPERVRRFYEWALAHGAVDMPWEEWIVFRKTLS